MGRAWSGPRAWILSPVLWTRLVTAPEWTSLFSQGCCDCNESLEHGVFGCGQSKQQHAQASYRRLMAFVTPATFQVVVIVVSQDYSNPNCDPFYSWAEISYGIGRQEFKELRRHSFEFWTWNTHNGVLLGHDNSSVRPMYTPPPPHKLKKSQPMN